MKVLFYLLGVLFFLPALSQEIKCGNINSIDAVDASHPVVKVAPKYGTFKKTSGCAVLVFELVAKPGTEGKVLIPKEVEVLYASEPRFGKASKVAVSKWLYLTKNIAKSPKYFTVLWYEIE